MNIHEIIGGGVGAFGNAVSHSTHGESCMQGRRKEFFKVGGGGRFKCHFSKRFFLH